MDSEKKLNGTRHYGILAAALAFYAIFIVRTSFTVLGTRYFVLFEDAMISMRYARNLAEGAGLTWNAGEERVEGYTNLLWTLWMSLFHKLGLPESKISLALMLSGVLILVGNAFVARNIAARVSGSVFAKDATFTAVLFCYPLVFWTLRGMEVGAVALVLDSLLLLALSMEESFSFARVAGMGALGAASVLLRSDTALSVGMIGLFAAWTAPKNKKLLTLVIIGGCAGATAVGHTLFRMSYYHDKLPNTAYLKLVNISLLARLKRGVFVTLQVMSYHLAIPLAVLVASVSSRVVSLRDAEGKRLGLIGAFIALQVAYALYVGGDAWEWMLYANRYESAAMTALIVLVCALLSAIVEKLAEEGARARFIKHTAMALMGLSFLALVLNAYAKVAPEEGIARTIVFSKKTAAAACAYALIAIMILARRTVLLQHWKNASTLLGTGSLALTACIFLPGQLEPFAFWAKKNAAQYGEEERYARLGILIHEATSPDFRLAVVAAGATPYFSWRPTEDLLGKNDKVVAREAPRGVFSPGHDKWDYEHSIGKKRPDLIVELADVTVDDRLYIASLGYEELPNGLIYRKHGGKRFNAALAKPYETKQEHEERMIEVRSAR